MRQAGRILPEYRAIRNRLSGFVELVRTPELAAEVTIQPVDILDVDAAIIFSDILVIPEAMGLPYQMVEKKGPYFPTTIKTMDQVKQLKVADPETDLHYVLDAIRLAKKELAGRVPLIGFAGAPWTVFAYMIEGSGSKTFSKARGMLYKEPELSHNLLEKITLSTIAYLKSQTQAGADLIQIFDSWAGILPKSHYLTFSLPYIQRICQAIENVPVTVFAKGAQFAMPEIGKTSCATIGLDWQMDIQYTRQLLGPEKTLQGNLDPCVLYASNQDIARCTRKMIDAFGTQRYIANLGHGVYPDTKVDAVKCFIETVKNYEL
ncbi:MAG: uroporphyrinogen decarboxylase [Cyclobacteriaceae bacterium]|nr:MAG: uroporphyrinogen decarboxylase [Cyclobacteriaceae bacterium]